jgi:hypothetical protein
MATRGKGQLTSAKGNISLLRVAETGDAWGAGDDILTTEVVFVLEGNDRAYGFDLHVGDKELPNALGMLSILRDAYFHKVPVGIAYYLEDNTKKTGYVRRIQVE